MPRGIFAAVVAASFGIKSARSHMEESWSQILQIVVLSELLHGDGTKFMLQARRWIHGDIASYTKCSAKTQDSHCT